LQKKRSVLNRRSAALKHVKNYLNFIGSCYKSFDDLPIDYDCSNFLGTFSNYLYKHALKAKACNIHKMHVSAIKCCIDEKFPIVTRSIKKSYTALRDNIECIFGMTEKAEKIS
jgi:hypothetical protein